MLKCMRAMSTTAFVRQKPDLLSILKEDAAKLIITDPNKLDPKSKLSIVASLERVKAQTEKDLQNLELCNLLQLLWLVLAFETRDKYESKLRKEKKSFKLLEWLRDIGTGKKHTEHSEALIKNS